MEKKLVVTRVFQSPVEEVWKMWTEPEYVKQWWGPDQFICPQANINFKVGMTSLVSMQAPKEFGGRVHYNSWHYTKIVHLQSIEFIMNLVDKEGNKQKPTDLGMPADFPEDIKTVVTFNVINLNETEMTVTEYADFGQMSHFAKLGLEQSLDKATLIFQVRE
ncbi:MAG TPA: SRPBCC domain-containing protein [Chitinophagaceae bacterium]|nr:SRPBCC domain-containing protein [Chitinophagaceae bacterium]